VVRTIFPDKTGILCLTRRYPRSPHRWIEAKYYGDQIELRPTARTDSSGISSEKAQRMLGWSPSRSWRDYLDENGKALSRITHPTSNSLTR
jgi:hypothetical protein